MTGKEVIQVELRWAFKSEVSDAEFQSHLLHLRSDNNVDSISDFYIWRTVCVLAKLQLISWLHTERQRGEAIPNKQRW